MARNSRLELEISQGGRGDFEQTMGGTYRDEGLSVGSDHMRLYGEIIQFQVFFSDLIMGRRIGQGACSSVNLATHRKTGETYAVKMFNVYDQAQATQLHKEISLLTRVECDALITLKGAFHDEGSIGIIIEYMDKGSLEFMSNKTINVSEAVMAAITFQIIWGLGYLHFENQIHRDVKPANILMNSQGQVKLSDFGISKELDGSAAMVKTAVGSYHYMSPERLLGDKYDASGDIWSVGITILQLWNKVYPFEKVSDTPIDLLSQIEKQDFKRLLGNGSKMMKDVLLSMLEKKSNRRATCQDIANSPWFDSCGVSSLVDAQKIVASWLRTLPKKQEAKRDAFAMSTSVEMMSDSQVYQDSKYSDRDQEYEEKFEEYEEEDTPPMNRVAAGKQPHDSYYHHDQKKQSRK